MHFMAMPEFDESLPAGPPPPALFAAMAEYATEGARNGTLVAQGGLLPSAAGFHRVAWSTVRSRAVDGPFTEVKELIGGYAVLKVSKQAEAVELAKGLTQIRKRSLARLGRCREVASWVNLDLIECVTDPTTQEAGETVWRLSRRG